MTDLVSSPLANDGWCSPSYPQSPSHISATLNFSHCNTVCWSCAATPQQIYKQTRNIKTNKWINKCCYNSHKCDWEWNAFASEHKAVALSLISFSSNLYFGVMDWQNHIVSEGTPSWINLVESSVWFFFRARGRLLDGLFVQTENRQQKETLSV